jgi:hypothetical protein
LIKILLNQKQSSKINGEIRWKFYY